MSARRRRILGIVATDSTFERKTVRGDEVWVGKCIHCNRRLVVEANGDTVGTIEHIVPRSHGGGDEIVNLALACGRCNREKGLRHDHRRPGDPGLSAVVQQLEARRRERWREPD